MQALQYGLPVALRLPLAAAAMIFVAAVTSTQTAMFFMGAQAERQVETLGQVYLDGLTAALFHHVSQGDRSSVEQVFHRALEFHEGVIDRRLVLLSPAQEAVVDVKRSGVADDSRIPSQVGATDTGVIHQGEGNIWIWRRLDHPAALHWVVAAKLDISSFEEGRGLLRWFLLSFDLAFSGICAVIGFFMVSRIQKPVTTVAQHLYEAALGILRPIDEAEIPAGDRQAARMFHAFNTMARATHEREGLLSHLADQDRNAVLGRLVATIAHEVRNPLGGMRAAISTLRRFGDRADTRSEAVEFLDRGVRTLEGVVTATLESYRARPAWRRLSRKDFEDLRLLVEADGRARGVAVLVDVDMEDEVPVAALEVRQVLLNLLLNAVHASAEGGIVRLNARVLDGELVVNVRDAGKGLNQSMARSIEAGEGVADAQGLGVSIVIRLVERLQGRVAIEVEPGLGTSITLHIPLQNDKVPS